MTDFAISPATSSVVVRNDLAAMLAAGELRAYRVRGNGTMRHVALYPLDSTGRDMAEWVSEQTNDGQSVAHVARDLHVSTAAVRRIIIGLELTEEIEAGEWNGLLTSEGLYADNVEVEMQDEVPPEARPGTDVVVTVTDRSAPVAAKPSDLHYCVCSMMNGERHARGVEGCRWDPANPLPSDVAQPRKARSHG
jgi:hypothetical protein